MLSIAYENEPANRASAFIMERRYLKNVSPKTVLWYHDSFKAFDGCQTEAEFKDRIVELRKRGVSAISVNTYLRCINAYLNWSEAGFKIPKLKEDRKVIQPFSPQQIQLLVNHRPQKYWEKRVWVFSLLLLDTGLRLSEGLEVRISDIDFDNLLLHVHGKGGKERMVPFSIELRKILYRFCYKDRGVNSQEPTGYAFPTQNLTRLSQRNCLRDFKKLCRKLRFTGVRCSPHTLRHTFALTYLRNGGNVMYLQKVLGHQSLEMTRRYLNLETADLSAVHGSLSPLCRNGR